MSPTRFQVDLGGLIALLSEHLYSGPQVFVRELLQNAVDAITARRALDPDAPATIRLWLDEVDGRPALLIRDTGIGLTGPQAVELLATIGASSKRDAFGGRRDFIGQFGVGMLAAFLVSDHIEITSRSAEPEASGIAWAGHANGEFEVAETADDLPVGTTVRLVAKAGAEHWFDEATLVSLASEFGSMLPLDVATQVTLEDGSTRWRRLTAPPPWQASYPSTSRRDAALVDYCERTFGFTPLAHIDLALPVAGLTGVAFVLPQAVAPSAGHSRVYVKGMLVGARVDHVLPEWAFFVRAVIASDTLTPAASREQLRRDDILLATQEALGDQIKRWVVDRLRSPGRIGRAFLATHHLALRALAVTDDTMLDLVADVAPFDTTDGPLTLREVRARGEVLFTSTLEAFRRIATVARAQNLCVVNAGYVYESDIMERLANKRGWRIREATPDDLTSVLGLVSPAREAQTASALVAARGVLADDDCDVVIRAFEPSSVPAVLLRDAENEYRRDLAAERSVEPDRWGDLLGAFDTPSVQRTRTLVLNDEAPIVRQLLATPPGDVFTASLRCLYLSAVMLAGEGLSSGHLGHLNQSLTHLMSAALAGTREGGRDESHE